MSSRSAQTVFAAVALTLVTAGNVAAQEQLAREVETALLRQADQHQRVYTETATTLDRPAQIRYELGAVIDVRAPRADGLPILAVTPGGAADRLGLQVGDQLLALNDRHLASTPTPATALEETLRDSGGAVRVEVRRDGQLVQSAGQADVVGIPAYRLSVGDQAGGPCGYVTTLQKPPYSELLFPALITQVDGASTPLSSRNRYRTGAGQHVLSVVEQIPGYRFNATQTIVRTRLHKLGAPSKQLVVDVRPDTSYRIAVRLLPDRLGAIRDNAHWEPVVWQEDAQACR